MFQNNNRAVIKHISRASFKNNKTRNRCAGAIIALAACLLAFSSTFGYNAANELKHRTDYQAIFENADAQMMEKIKAHPEIETFGISRQAGAAQNENIRLSLLYADEHTLELSRVRIKTGSMPEKADHIAIEKGYLDSIQSGAQVGDSITLNYRNDISREMQEGRFVITGLLEAGPENDPDRRAYSAIVSQAFIDSDPALSSAHPSIVIKVADADKYSNGDLKTKIEEIGRSAGFPEQSVKMNEMNIDSNNATFGTSAVVLAVAAVIVTACSLAIYNIFYITIMHKVNEYGQLRTIGTTRRQIKKIVFREGKILSAQYIPAGILAGCGGSCVLQPSGWIAGPSLTMALCSGLITFLTVMLSLRKPAGIAARVSPLEAVRYTDYRLDFKETRRAAKKLTPYALGRMYLTRSRKKTALTFLSLTLSGILFIAAASLLSSIDSAKRAREAFPYGGEYMIRLNGELLSPTTSYSDLQMDNPLSDELKAQITAIRGVDGIEVHKYIQGRLAGANMDEPIIEINNIREKDSHAFEPHLVDGALPESSTGGRQILINRATSLYRDFNLDYRPGDQIAMILWDGKTQIEEEFTVSGIVENKNSGNTFFLPDDIMDELMAQNCNYAFEILSDQGYSAEVEAELRGLAAFEDKLEFKSMKEQTALYRSSFRSIAMTVYAFVALIACFGLLNLVNTLATNILSRKKEIGILQAVGLSKGQLIQMLNAENAYLIFGSFIVSAFLGSVLGYIVCRTGENIGGLSFIDYQFPFGMMAAYFALIVVVQTIATRFIGWSMQKQSIVHRLREA